MTVKAKGVRSMKQIEAPHTLSVTVDSECLVKSGRCSFVAGVGGHCNHVFALLYSIDHTLKLKPDSFPRSKTCTDKPAEWIKCRTDDIRSDPVKTLTLQLKLKYSQ